MSLPWTALFCQTILGWRWSINHFKENATNSIPLCFLPIHSKNFSFHFQDVSFHSLFTHYHLWIVIFFRVGRWVLVFVVQNHLKCVMMSFCARKHLAIFTIQNSVYCLARCQCVSAGWPRSSSPIPHFISSQT